MFTLHWIHRGLTLQAQRPKCSISRQPAPVITPVFERSGCGAAASQGDAASSAALLEPVEAGSLEAGAPDAAVVAPKDSGKVKAYVDCAKEFTEESFLRLSFMIVFLLALYLVSL